MQPCSKAAAQAFTFILLGKTTFMYSLDFQNRVKTRCPSLYHAAYSMGCLHERYCADGVYFKEVVDW